MNVADELKKILALDDDNLIFPVPKNYKSKLKWGGPFNGTFTFSGLPFDIAKSVFQKAVRRNLAEVALLITAEIYELQDDGGKAAVTNLINRTLIIAMEDKGPIIYPFILYYMRKVVDGEVTKAFIFNSVNYLAKAAGSRTICHFLGVYCTPGGRKKGIKNGIDIEKLDSIDEEYIRIAMKKKSYLFYDSDPKKLKIYILMFHKRLEERSHNAYTWFYYFRKYIEENSLKLEKRRKYDDEAGFTTDPIIMIWWTLKCFLLQSEYELICKSYFRNRGRDEKYYISLGIFSIIFSLQPKKFTFEEKLSKEDIAKYCSHSSIIKVPSFAIDKHTSFGKKLGAGHKEFVTIGAELGLVDDTYNFPELIKVYNMRN